ncbi:MAG: lipase family protein [Desulfobacterales bacterium]|nr:lipase family protein [Desulfobacterales bacterium]
MEHYISIVTNFITENWDLSAIVASVVSFIAGSGIFSFLRRPKNIGQGDVAYFTDESLLQQPKERPAYSDRTAFVLAEMSALAYWKFEARGASIRNAAEKMLEVLPGNAEEAKKWLEGFADDLLIQGADSEAFLRKVLEKSGFQLLGTVSVAGTQGFVAKRTATGEEPYVVVSYRGTEKNVEDWLTDAKAVPTEVGKARVHTGFREALMDKQDAQGKTALERVKEILDTQDAKDNNGEALPLFITGHSLGGALALLTTVEAAKDVNGACYTYGAPRVANYEYFEGLKTPVFRIVNSADIVPRVPPGAIIALVLKLFQGLSWASGFMPGVSKAFDWVEAKLDKLKGYRHFGDQRYLTDVKSGRFEEVKLLHNPPAIDRILWMGQQLGITFFAPVKSHGMAIYRKKLALIAGRRNPDT